MVSVQFLTYNFLITNIIMLKSNFFRVPILQYPSSGIIDDDFKAKPTAIKSNYKLRS